jgi:hypothetical protein
MFERAPNGYFVRDLVVFNQLRRGGQVAKGFFFEAPDLTNSPVSDLNDFQDQLCLLLASLHENQRLQVQYFCDCDYKSGVAAVSGGDGAVHQRMDAAAPGMSDSPVTGRPWGSANCGASGLCFYVTRALEAVPKAFQSAAARREYYGVLLGSAPDGV